MINYYRVLGVKSSASNSDIKSAYRKLARQRHPDVSESPTAARDFDLISKAYHVLSDPQERAYYDEQLNAQNTAGYSILQSNNPHARRARNLAVQAKWDRVVDEVLERDRMENRERQRVVFTTVSLFLSTFFVALIRPPLWQIFDYAGRAVVLTLFVIGIWHLATRLREYFAHYTYIPKPFTYTIMREDEKPEQPFTRFSAYTFLLVGYALSVGVGLFISWQTQDFFTDISSLFHQRVGPVQANILNNSSQAFLVADLLLYPPIAVLIVDSMQAVVARIE